MRKNNEKQRSLHTISDLTQPAESIVGLSSVHTCANICVPSPYAKPSPFYAIAADGKASKKYVIRRNVKLKIKLYFCIIDN